MSHASHHFRPRRSPRRRAAPTRPPLPRPQLGPDVDLLGAYEGSGLREPPYLIGRAGHVLQVSRLVFLVASALDGERDLAAVARHVSKRYGRTVSADNVRFLVESKLEPVGIAALDAAPAAVELSAPAPLALTVRTPFLPAEVVRPLAALLRPLFAPVVVGAAVAWLVTLDVWLFGNHGIGRGVEEMLAQPIWVLASLALVVGSTLFHEFGHAAACRYGGGRPGAIGAGLYLVWPVFYTDVTDAYRLSRAGRVRTDLGGVYFNILFALGLAAVYFKTGWEPLLVLIAFEHVQIASQFVPWGRFDGYYVLTDITGVPDVLARLRPILLSLIPDRPREPRVEELKPWVRVVVSAYVVTLVVGLTALAALLLVHLPAFVATARRTFEVQGALLVDAARSRQPVEAAVALVQLGIVGLSVAAVSLTLWSLARLLTRPLLRRRRLRVAAAVTAGVAAAVLGFGLAVEIERGSARPSIRDASALPEGRPGRKGTIGRVGTTTSAPALALILPAQSAVTGLAPETAVAGAASTPEANPDAASRSSAFATPTTTALQTPPATTAPTPSTTDTTSAFLPVPTTTESVPMPTETTPTTTETVPATTETTPTTTAPTTPTTTETTPTTTTITTTEGP